MSMDEYNEIMSVVNQIEFAADEMKNDTVAELDKMVEKLTKVWQGEASDEYILRMKALRDWILNTVKSVYEAVENMSIEINNQYLMKSFSVESTGLMNGIDSLSRRNEELGIQIKKMQESKEALNATWDGVAKNTFSATVDNDVAKMNNFMKLIEQYCSALKNIMTNYQNAEAENANQMAKRG